MWKRTAAVAALALVLVAPERGSAQDDFDPHWALAFGSGFTADPETWLLGLEFERRLARHFALGLLFQLGLEKDDTLAAPHGYARYVFQVHDDRGEARLEPFVQAGVGFTHLDRDGNGRHRGHNTSFSMIFGGGIDYNFTRSFAVGTKMLVGVVPADVLGESAYFSWEIARLKISF